MINSIINMVVYSITNVQGENVFAATTLVIFFAFALIVYWIVLLYSYEKEDKYEDINYLTDEKIFRKYNPLLAGCITQNRAILSRDIIAVLLNLSNKGIIKLEVVKDSESKKKNQYKYMLYRIREKEYLMDSIERQIHFMVFKYVHSIDDGVDLIKKLQDIPKEKIMYQKFRDLEKNVKRELNKFGANINSVPKVLKVVNVLVIIITILLCIYHISQVAFNFEVTLVTLFAVGIVAWFMMMSVPFMVAIGYLILKIIGHAKKGISNINEKNFYGKKIFSRAIEIIICTIIIMIITAFLTHNVYFVIDIFTIGIAYLIVGTDHLMIKNDKTFLKDYESIKRLKEKIEAYSNLKERDVEQIKLWKEYLAYSVAFGISTRIEKYIDALSVENELLKELNNYDLLDASLEVFWGFKDSRNDKGIWFGKYRFVNKYYKIKEERARKELEKFRKSIDKNY